MIKKTPFKKWMIVAFLIVIGAIGFTIAAFISKTNAYIARGVLGCVVIYFILRGDYFRSPWSNESIETLDNSYSIKYFAVMFGVSIIFYWGLSEALQLFFWIIRNLLSFSGAR